MAADESTYYQPVSTLETSALDAFSVRGLAEIGAGANNYARYVACFPLINEWCLPNWVSGDTGVTTETVIAIWPRILVPDGFDKIAWHIGHSQTTGTGNVTWRLYSSGTLLQGGSTFSATNLSADYGTDSIITTGGAAHVVTAASTSCQIARNNDGETYLVLTAQNTSGNNASLTTIDAAAVVLA